MPLWGVALWTPLALTRVFVACFTRHLERSLLLGALLSSARTCAVGVACRAMHTWLDHHLLFLTMDDLLLLLRTFTTRTGDFEAGFTMEFVRTFVLWTLLPCAWTCAVGVAHRAGHMRLDNLWLKSNDFPCLLLPRLLPLLLPCLVYLFLWTFVACTGNFVAGLPMEFVGPAFLGALLC